MSQATDHDLIETGPAAQDDRAVPRRLPRRLPLARRCMRLLGAGRGGRAVRAALLGVCALGMIGITPAVSRAQEAREDVRLKGYKDVVQLTDKPSTANKWFGFVGILVVCVGVMFKNSRRSHLD